MNGAAAPLIDVLREELAPVPGRWRQAIFTALGTTVALGCAVIVQDASFVAPATAYLALQPTAVCTWRGLLRRLLTAALAGIILLNVGGVVVQLPWLLLPFFFVAVSLLSYFVSMISRPLDVLAVMYSVIMTLVTGIFDPSAMGPVVLHVVCAYAMGVTVGTAFAQLVAPQRPRDRLVEGLAAGFAASRERLRGVGTHYCAAVVEAPRPLPAPPSLAQYLQLFDLVRQERLGHRPERALLAFMIAAERAQVAITVAAGLADEPVGRTYRRLIAPELGGLLAALDTALATFAAATHDADRMADEPAPGPPPEAWPDLAHAVAAVEARQLTLRQAGAFADVDMAEAANADAFIYALKSLADVMHTPPGQLAHMAAVEARPDLVSPPSGTLFRFDPYAARWSLQVGLGMTLAYVLVVISHVQAFFTALWNPLFIAQSSYGATIRKSGLRILGVFLGAALGLFVITGVMPNITGLTSLLIVFFVVLVPCQYVALGGVRIAHVGVQTAFSFIIVMVAEQPMVDVEAPLWRAFGTLVGTACLFVVFRLVAPDYAGRQLIARFRDLLSSIIALLPRADAMPLSAGHLLQVRRDLGTAAADIMRLAEEARLEGHSSGVDPRAAVNAVGLATRIAHRSALIHRGRFLTPWPPLSHATHGMLVAVESGVRERLTLLLRLLDARHTTARPGSRPFRATVDAAAAVATVPRPELAEPLARLARHLDEARVVEFAQWPPSAAGALFAELDHLERICDLLPRLDDELIRTSLSTLSSAPTAQDASLAAGTLWATLRGIGG